MKKCLKKAGFALVILDHSGPIVPDSKFTDPGSRTWLKTDISGWNILLDLFSPKFWRLIVPNSSKKIPVVIQRAYQYFRWYHLWCLFFIFAEYIVQTFWSWTLILLLEDMVWNRPCFGKNNTKSREDWINWKKTTILSA